MRVSGNTPLLTPLLTLPLFVPRLERSQEILTFTAREDRGSAQRTTAHDTTGT